MRLIVMLDRHGFRPNVGIILVNDAGKVFWARRVGGNDAWQFPQGGIQKKESPEDALFRELDEEVGLADKDVKVLAKTRDWLRYRLPGRFVRPRDDGRVCVGQKQKWFMLQMLVDDGAVNFNNTTDEPPEFDRWQWVSYWYPVNKVVSFKREVYRRALKELAPHQQRLQRA